jgi:hypothetical protein
MELSKDDRQHAIDMLLSSMDEKSLLELVRKRSMQTALEEEEARFKGQGPS